MVAVRCVDGVGCVVGAWAASWARGLRRGRVGGVRCAGRAFIRFGCTHIKPSSHQTITPSG
eukprot:917140-Prymnesium_polylepis.1